MDGLRILVASPLGLIIQPALAARFPDGTVTVAQDPGQVERAVRGQLRHDVVVSDLMWNSEAEFTFDGLDVLEILHGASPVVMATQGHGMEADHLEEVLARREVRGIYRKSDGPQLLFDVLTDVAGGATARPAPDPIPTIHGWFAQGRGGRRRGWPGRSRPAGPRATRRSRRPRTSATTPPPRSAASTWAS